MAPTDAPVTISGFSPASVNVRNTPMCAQPRAEPLPRARPMRGRRVKPEGMSEGEYRVAPADVDLVDQASSSAACSSMVMRFDAEWFL